MKFIIALILSIASSLTLAQGKNKDSSLERAIRDEVADELSGDKQKGHGKPSNPGAHGRANAASKAGGGGNQGNDSLLGDIIDEIEEDDREDEWEDRKGGKNKDGKGKNK